MLFSWTSPGGCSGERVSGSDSAGRLSRALSVRRSHALWRCGGGGGGGEWGGGRWFCTGHVCWRLRASGSSPLVPAFY
eukprot:3208203-Alexandrium_andersonii.AAC.1